MSEQEEPGAIQIATAPPQADPPRPPPRQLMPAGKARDTASGFQRTRNVLNATLPVLERLLPLLDGNFASAALNLVAPRPTAPSSSQVDLGPVERSLAELQARQQKLSSQLAAQSLPLDQLREQLVPELQRQVEELKLSAEALARNQEKTLAAQDRFQKRFNQLAAAGILLLAMTLAANLFLLAELLFRMH
jgi:septal ring factor EnvC (AmiA/AmiB activator)